MEYYSMRTVHRRILIFRSKKNPIEKLDIATPSSASFESKKLQMKQSPKFLPPKGKVSKFQRKIRSKRRRKKKERNCQIPRRNSSIDRKGSGGEIWKKYIFFPSAPPHPVCRATAARGKVEGHVNTSGRERSLNKSA